MDTLTRQTLKEWYKQYNAEYFGGRLPFCTLNVKSCKSYLGICYPKKRTISISTFYKRDERGYRETLIHEMIHLWNYLYDSNYIGHGKPFKRKAAEINKKGGWNIQRCSDISAEEKQTASAKRNESVYAIVIDTNSIDGKLHFSIVSSSSYDNGQYRNTLRMFTDKGWKISVFMTATEHYPTYRVCRKTISGKYRTRQSIQKEISENKLYPMTSFLYKKAI
jgi:predicted SprT family Zn-dependent metalloprotease